MDAHRLHSTDPTPFRLLWRVLRSQGMMLLGLSASLAALALAVLLPQVPRQRAIAMVESRGGTLSYNTTYPDWVYESLGPERVQRFESVYEINLDGADVDDAVIVRLLQLKEAGIVWLNSSQISDRGAMLLANFDSITSLDLGSTNLTDRSLVPVLERHTRLQTLWLQYTRAGDDALRALAGTKTLQNLSLYNTEVTDAGLAHLAGHTALVTLDLDNTAVGDEGIAQLAGCRSLTDLSLANTLVSGPGLDALARLPSLRDLNLSGTPVGDDGARRLAAATSLRTLVLDGTNVTDAGLAHLAAIPTLSTLSLNGVEITSEGLEHLRQATHLSELYIDTHLLTPEDLSQLREALPNCSVNNSEDTWDSTYSGGFF